MPAEKSPFSLTDSLNEKAYSASVTATYNAYLPFYEQVVLRRLLAAGCSHNIVLMDAAQCAAALARDELRPRLAGTDYMLVPIPVTGAFHPKIFLRLGRKKGSLFVGSHNLTVAGFGLNDELTNLFVHQGTGAENVQPFKEVIDFLRASLPEDCPQLRDAFENAIQMAPWLRSPAPVDPAVRVLSMAPASADLWSQLRPLIRGTVRRAFVTAPFFDSRLEFITRLSTDLKPKELVVAIDPECVAIPADKGKKFRTARFVDAAQRPVIRKSREEIPPAYLHAKAYWFETDEAEVLVTGSANASWPAFIGDDNGRNSELVVVRIGKPGRALAKEIGLDDLLRLPDVSDEEWDQIAARPRPIEARDEASPPACIAIVSNSGFVLDRSLPASAIISILDVNGVTIGKAVLEQNGPRADIAAAAEFRDAARILEIAEGNGIIRAVVHHPARIAELYSGDTRRALRQALGTIDDDPGQMELLLKLAEKVIFDADGELTIPVSQQGAGRKGNEKKEQPEEESPESLALDAQGKHPAFRRRKSIATGDITVLLDALIRRLGEGLVERRSPAGTNEEETGSDDETDELPAPPPDLHRLASLCRRKVRRLLGRMEGQLELADEQPGRAIVQLAAVLGVLQRLRIIEQRPEWRQTRETLLDRDQLPYFFEVASQAVGYGSQSLGRRSVAANDGEIFEEVSFAVGLLAWMAWECEPEPEENLEDDEWPEPVDQAELLRWQQHLLYLAAHLIDDDHARDIAREAISKAPRRGVDAMEWWTVQRNEIAGFADVARDLLRAKRSKAPITAGDFVVLPADFDPRLRVALSIEFGNGGPTVTVVDIEKEDGVRKFVATFLERVERSEAPDKQISTATSRR